MRVVIAGAGSVGRSIARELLGHGHEVTIIDRQPSAMRVAQVADAEWLLADACELPTLTEANSKDFVLRASAPGAASEPYFLYGAAKRRGRKPLSGRKPPAIALQRPNRRCRMS